MAKRNRNILVARFAKLGDVAMSLPTVYNACAASPDTQFFFITQPHPAHIFVNPPHNLVVMGVTTDNYKGIAGKRRLAKALKSRYEIDRFIDLENSLSTRLLRFFLRMEGIRSYHIFKNLRGKRKLTRRNNKVMVQLKPTADRYRDVFYKAGIPLANDFKSLYGSGKGDEKEFIVAVGRKRLGEKWMAVAPFALHQGKIYPIELMEKVINHYAAQPEWKIFIFGFGNSEAEKIDKLAQGRPAIMNMARSELGIPGELSLLSHCDVMLSMDSANMHLASLVGLRTVSVWGATHPFAGYLGWNQKTADVAQLEMVCRPCSVYGERYCQRGDYHCLWGITPAMIISKIDREL